MATERVQERFVYGMTIGEVDRLLELNRRITATNDIFANGGADFANEKSVHALGQAAYENGLSIHEALIGLRKLDAEAVAMSSADDPSDSGILNDIRLSHCEIDAVVHAIYQIWNDGLKGNENTIYGLVMALERSNNAIGRLAGVI